MQKSNERENSYLNNEKPISNKAICVGANDWNQWVFISEALFILMFVLLHKKITSMGPWHHLNSVFFKSTHCILFPSGTIWIPLPIQTKKKENEKRARITDPTRASRAKDEIFHPTKHHTRFTSFASPPAESILYEPYVESISWFSWMITVGFQKHFIKNARLMALDDDNWVGLYFVVFRIFIGQRYNTQISTCANTTYYLSPKYTGEFEKNGNLIKSFISVIHACMIVFC